MNRKPTDALTEMPAADRDVIRALSEAGATVLADAILPSGYRITATEANHAIAGHRLLDVLDGHTDCPTDPVRLAPLIDVASAMQSLHLRDRLLLEFSTDPDDADRCWASACDLLADGNPS